MQGKVERTLPMTDGTKSDEQFYKKRHKLMSSFTIPLELFVTTAFSQSGKCSTPSRFVATQSEEFCNADFPKDYVYTKRWRCTAEVRFVLH